jgi:hypothetical protein
MRMTALGSANPTHYPAVHSACGNRPPDMVWGVSPYSRQEAAERSGVGVDKLNQLVELGSPGFLSTC